MAKVKVRGKVKGTPGSLSKLIQCTFFSPDSGYNAAIGSHWGESSSVPCTIPSQFWLQEVVVLDWPISNPNSNPDLGLFEYRG